MVLVILNWWIELKKLLPNAWSIWKSRWLATHQLAKSPNTLTVWAQFSWTLFIIWMLENANPDQLEVNYLTFGKRLASYFRLWIPSTTIRWRPWCWVRCPYERYENYVKAWSLIEYYSEVEEFSAKGAKGKVSQQQLNKFAKLCNQSTDAVLNSDELQDCNKLGAWKNRSAHLLNDIEIMRNVCKNQATENYGY